MNAPWGEKAVQGHNAFDERSLWATRAKAPFWLLILANSIIVAVWGVIIYLVVQIFKLKKLGTL